MTHEQSPDPPYADVTRQPRPVQAHVAPRRQPTATLHSRARGIPHPPTPPRPAAFRGAVFACVLMWRGRIGRSAARGASALRRCGSRGVSVIRKRNTLVRGPGSLGRTGTWRWGWSWTWSGRVVSGSGQDHLRTIRRRCSVLCKDAFLSRGSDGCFSCVRCSGSRLSDTPVYTEDTYIMYNYLFMYMVQINQIIRSIFFRPNDFHKMLVNINQIIK